MFFPRCVCFFSGTEQNQKRARLAAVKHILKNCEAFTPSLRPGFVSAEGYISRSGIKYVKAWATELEILSVADMLGINVLTFSSSRWLKYSSSHIRFSEEPTDCGRYLQHFRNSHYDAICCARQDKEGCKYCNGNC